MNKPLNLKDIQKEVVSNINSLKASLDTTDYLAKSKQAKKHLLEIREKLQKHIRVGHHNLNVLQRDTSGDLQKVKEIEGSEIDKIRMTIREIDSALDSFRQTDKNTGSLAKSGRYCSFNKDTNLMNSAEEKDPLRVTYQTMALMDADRYGTAGQGTIVNYPNPALGASANPRDYDIGDKIRIGLSISGGDGQANCRITIPKCFQNFCGGKD
ncbi:hypothetical protein ACFL3G_00070 [Planctomycetota bacterium]